MERKVLYNTVKKAILIKFDFLTNKGYEITKIDYADAPYNSKENIENLYISFTHIQFKREIKLYYVPFQSESNIDLHNFSFTIWDKKNMAHIEIGNFMKLRHKDEYIQLTLRSFEGVFEEKLDQLLDYVVNIMQKYLLDVLEGEKWINVPMDWGGAK